MSRGPFGTCRESGISLILLAVLVVASRGTLGQDSPRIGIDSNYVLEMSASKKEWKLGEEAVDPFAFFAAQGCQGARIRLWVGDEGMNRLHYATQTALRAKKAGLKPYLVIFLSEDWADFVKQPVPASWKELTLEEKAASVEAYSSSVVRHMAKQGVEIDTFEIGNEIDFGICGEFEEEWPKRMSLEYMRARIWPRMIPILKAAQAGVLKEQPRAKFILHLAQWNNVDYCLEFWKAMTAAGVRLDYPGLSYFPSSAKEPSQRPVRYLTTQAERIVKELHKPVLICETAYPATAEFGGQFAEWKYGALGYPLSADGQAKWIADFTNVIRRNPNFCGVYYFSPEWYDGGLWDAFSLFDAQGVARPGVRSFAPPNQR